MTEWRARFDRLVERKTREAAGAELAPYLTELDAAPREMRRIGNDWTERLFDGPFYLSEAADRELPAASLVFVQSRDGNTGAQDPSALGGGETDRHLIYEGLSRAAADAVLAGAETIRGSDVLFSVWRPEIVALRVARGLPRHPTQIVATLRGLAFEATLLYNVPDVPVIVITVPGYAREMERELADRPWITPLVMRDGDDLRSAFVELGRLGVRRISVVGGRTIARALVRAGLVQDLYLTTAAKSGGEPGTPLFAKPVASSVVLRKRGTGPDDGVKFEQLAFGQA